MPRNGSACLSASVGLAAPKAGLDPTETAAHIVAGGRPVFGTDIQDQFDHFEGADLSPEIIRQELWYPRYVNGNELAVNNAHRKNPNVQIKMIGIMGLVAEAGSQAETDQHGARTLYVVSPVFLSICVHD